MKTQTQTCILTRIRVHVRAHTRLHIFLHINESRNLLLLYWNALHFLMAVEPL